MDTAIKREVFARLGHPRMACILEIGAHFGEDTIDMAEVFDRPFIFCFEPDPRNAAFMRKKFKIVGITGPSYKGALITVHELALFSEEGDMDFHMSYAPFPDDKPVPPKYAWMGDDYRKMKLNNSGGSSLKQGHEAVRDAEVVRVKTSRLDDVMPRHSVSVVDFIWMDVQGAEREVIEGGRETFSNTKFVWTEYGETAYDGAMDKRQTIALFDELGFVPDTSRDNNILFVNTRELQ